MDAACTRVTEEHKVELRGARAGARHDGHVIGGVLSESEGIDNYLGELAAQINVLNLANAVDRVATIFDATSNACKGSDGFVQGHGSVSTLVDGSKSCRDSLIEWRVWCSSDKPRTWENQ